MPHVPDTVPGKRVTDAGARTEGRGQPSNIRGGSRMQESCPYGSVRGAPSNGRPYRNPAELFTGAVPDVVMAHYLIQDHGFLDSFLTLLGGALATADTSRPGFAWAGSSG
jgi:hypothetical protein